VAARMKKDPKRNDHYYSVDPHAQTRFGLIRTCLKNVPFEFLTASSVFSVKRVDLGTRVLVESMILPEKGCVLDLGCGYGVVGIAVAKFNPNLHVVLTDVNKRAALLAKRNAEKNSVSNIQVRQGSLYNPVQGLCFDCVLSNPPVSAGMETVEAIIRGAPIVIREKGSFQMVVRSKIGKKTLPALFKESFGNVEVLAIRSGYRVLIAKRL
jgi:16S rRNA (guanine1207-N2)-methyltransferase